MINGTDVYGALAELVRLKGLKDKIDLGTATIQEHEDYDGNKAAAWRRAREAAMGAEKSILARIQPNEPLFILRAQDRLAIGTVFGWELKARSAGCPKEKTEGAIAIARAMASWPERKRPD